MVIIILEMMASKLIDILGDQGAALAKKDRTLKASYDVQRALREMDAAFGSVIRHLQEIEDGYESGRPYRPKKAAGRDADLESYYGGTLCILADDLAALDSALDRLKTAFGQMENKYEVYRSLEAAQAIRLFIGRDANFLDHLRRGFFCRQKPAPPSRPTANCNP